MSQMAHSFHNVPAVHMPRSTFDRSHNVKTTINEQDLVPIFVDEVLPGDTHSLNLNAFGRLATPIFPIMDNMYLDFFFFFVPCRLVWTHWVNFNGEQPTGPLDSTSYLVPTVTIPFTNTHASVGKLADYFGIPCVSTQIVGGNLVVNALPFRAYNLIWNEWFRDENINGWAAFDKTSDGPDPNTQYGVLPRLKRKDYFTSCLPWPQKGPSVGIPLGGSAPVYAGGTVWPTIPNAALQMKTTANTFPGGGTALGIVGASGGVQSTGTAITAGTPIAPANLYADLGSATAATINQLRQAFQIQKIYERDARGGTRYIELLRSHFGVVSPDARLQRPEYLGGGVIPINISPIAQTGGTGAQGTTTPQGNLAAMGTMHTRRGSVGFTKSFTEHGYIIGMVNFRADLSYQDGLDKLWTRSTRFDFYWPSLAHIGEQAVLTQEIYAQGTATDTTVFGYQERYGEYRQKLSKICGLFRSAAPTPLDTWHLSQHFATAPALNSSFIADAPPVSRVVAVPSQPRVLLDVFFNLRSARPMPVYGVPGFIDHF